jgi:hypothetical protein
MSTDKRKINVGLLPEQSEDYSRYEESELNWGRIIFAAVIVLIIVVFSIYSLLKSEEVPTNKLNSLSSIEQAPKNINTPTTPTIEPKKAQLKTKATDPEAKPQPLTEVAEAKTPKSVEAPLEKEITKKEASLLIEKVTTNSEVETILAPKTHQKKTSPQQTQAYVHPVKTVSPVKILDKRIKKAQLSSNLIKGLPIDSLSSQVHMSEEGIIRVHLYTEMEDLRGQNLFHHWYRNGEKQASVRVPVNHNHQRSSSSKFINKQMLGKWTVQVLNEEGKAYIEVNFEVVKP